MGCGGPGGASLPCGAQAASKAPPEADRRGSGDKALPPNQGILWGEPPRSPARAKQAVDWLRPLQCFRAPCSLTPEEQQNKTSQLGPHTRRQQLAAAPLWNTASSTLRPGLRGEACGRSRLENGEVLWVVRGTEASPVQKQRPPGPWTGPPGLLTVDDLLLHLVELSDHLLQDLLGEQSLGGHRKAGLARVV